MAHEKVQSDPADSVAGQDENERVGRLRNGH